ncbi:MAG: hypothetical protein AB1505_10225 [Candidatus Latescibacterota bacterium]
MAPWVRIRGAAGIARRGEGVRFGVPLSPAALADPAGLQVSDAGGTVLPAQLLPLARWPDGSLRWVLVSLQVDVPPFGEASLRIGFGQTSGAPASPCALPSLARQDGGRVVVDTGAIAVAVGAGISAAFQVVRAADLPALAAGPALRIESADGQVHGQQPPDHLEIEENGPLCACVFASGPLGVPSSAPTFRYETRLFLWRDRAEVHAEHTFVNVGEEPVAGLRRVTLSYAWEQPVLGFSASAGPGPQSRSGTLAAGDALRLEQACRFWQELGRREDGEADYYVKEAGFSCALRQNGRLLQAGEKAAGWVLAAGGEGVCGTAVRHFWQHGPKGIEVRAGGGWALDLVPCLQPEASGPGGAAASAPLRKWVPFWGRGPGTRQDMDRDMALQGYGGPAWDAPVRFGRSRAVTHEVLYLFAPAAAAAEACQRLAGFTAPLVPVVDPAYLCATGALRWVTPADPGRWPLYEEGMARGLAAYQTRALEYGLLHFGDLKLAYGNYSTAPGSYANHEYDTVHGLLVQLARTGEPDCLRRAGEAARHLADVDVDQMSGAPRMHGYMDTGEQHEECYTTGPVDHAYAEGLADHYCFTGDRRSLRAALRIAGHCRSAPQVLAERGVAGTDGRTIARPCLALLAVHDLTGDPRFLEPVDQVVEALTRYAGDPQEGLGEAVGWRPWLGEGEHLSEHIDELLCRYHALTGSAEALAALRRSLDRFLATWDPETERFVGRMDRIGHAPTRLRPPLPVPVPGQAGVSNELALAYLASVTGEPRYLLPVLAGLQAYGRGVDRAIGNRDFPAVRLLSAHFIALVSRMPPGSLAGAAAPRAALAAPLGPSLTAHTESGTVSGTAEGEVRFVTSPFGQPALETGHRGRVRFPVPPDLLRLPGSLCLWVSQDLTMPRAPEMAPHPRGLVHLTGDEPLASALDVHLTYNTLWVRLYDGRGWLTACLELPVAHWRAGEWHHLAVVWNRFTLTGHMDGQRLAQEPAWLPEGEQRMLWVGWRPLNWYAGCRFHGLQVYRTPLPPYRVRALYEEECPYGAAERQEMARYRDEGRWQFASGGIVALRQACPLLAADEAAGAPP